MKKNENIFEKLEEEEKKAKKSSLFRVVFFLILFVIFIFIVYKVATASMGNEEVKNSLEVVSYRTQWVDKEVTPFEVSVVPAIWIKIKNVGERDIQYLQLNGRFEFCDSGTVHSSGSVAVFEEPFPPGRVSHEILI